MDTTPQTAVTWMVDGVAVDTSPGRISTDGATLSFSPLTTLDTGNYTCICTVTVTGEALSSRLLLVIMSLSLKWVSNNY